MDKFEEDSDVLVDEDVDILLDDIELGEMSFLIVHNDEHNTFDWVIRCFIEVLEYDEVRSDQLAHIIHFKGKATVKTASFSVLKPAKDALCDRGLSAVIETKTQRV